MDIKTFVNEHRASWQKAEALLSKFNKRDQQVNGQDIEEMSKFYRQISSHLAYAHTYFPNDPITRYLNELAANAHQWMYREQNTSRQQLRYFFREHFTNLVYIRRWFILFAMGLMLIGFVAGFVTVMIDPLYLYTVLPSNMAQQIDPHSIGEGHDLISRPLISAEIMTNNIRVAVLAFVGGITFGLLTVYVLIFNGLLIGALAALFLQAGQSYLFWAYILPHGILELTVIFIAGGAGLYLGYKMLVPGPHPRKHVILRAARESVQLLLGTIPLFVIAGLIEGYVTPSAIAPHWKYAFSLLTLLLIAAYYLYGRAVLLRKEKTTKHP